MKQQPPSQRIGYFPQQEQPAPQTPPPRRRAQRNPEQAAEPQRPAPRQPASPYADVQRPASQYATPQRPTRTARSAAQQPRTAHRKPPLRIPARLIMLIVCAGVFVTCSFLLVRYFSNIIISRQASQQLEEVYSAAMQNTEVPAAPSSPTPTPEAVQAAAVPLPAALPEPAPSPSEIWPAHYPSNPSLRVSSVFYELQRQNPDIVGWLKIDGVLEEAVVQRDNSYYLTHNALKQRSVTGALFLDESCDLKKVPTQMLIHGHNMKEGAMFGSLKKYKVKDASFYRAHPFIDFNTVYENGRYVIFAVAEVDLRYGKHDYLPFWRDVRFSTVDSFTDYVNKARSLSHYRCNVDVQPGDRLLTLSTCTGTDDNKRLLVMARKLRDGEDALQLNMSILSTDDR
ncbi:MAG: sortase [bacterium]|nr:sortase [bacterium]